MDEEAFQCPACLKPLVVDTKDQLTYICMNCEARLEPDAETLIDLLETKPHE